MARDDAMSQTDVVVNGIRELIMSGELLPGERLPIEKDLAPRFGVSRGSLREGVRALSHLGILETRQGSGTYVTALRPEVLLAPLRLIADLQPGTSVSELQEVRRILETASVRMATLNIDEQGLEEAQKAVDEGARVTKSRTQDPEVALEADMAFHHALAQASGNRVLASLLDALSSRTARARLWRALVDASSAARAVEEHGEILDAVRSGDPEVAAVRMANHLLSVESFLGRRATPRADEHVDD